MKEGWKLNCHIQFLLEEKPGEQTEAGPHVATDPVSLQPGYPELSGFSVHLFAVFW